MAPISRPGGYSRSASASSSTTRRIPWSPSPTLPSLSSAIRHRRTQSCSALSFPSPFNNLYPGEDDQEQLADTDTEEDADTNSCGMENLPRTHSRSSSTANPQTADMLLPSSYPTHERGLLSWLGMNVLHSNTLITPTVRIIFQAGVVDMIGAPCTSTSYSLPGTVMVTLPSLPPGTEGCHRLVKDVTIVVEGQSEYWDATGRYNPLRLFTATLPLLPANKPQSIPSHSRHDQSGDVTVAFPFDLRVPGWLPPTMMSTFTANAYGAVAHVQVGWNGRSFCRSLRPSAAKMVVKSSDYTTFIVRRHRVPTALRPTATIRTRTFARERFSSQLLKKVDFIVAVPEWVDMYTSSLDLSLRVRVREPKSNTRPPAANQGATSTCNVSTSDGAEVSSYLDESFLSSTGPADVLMESATHSATGSSTDPRCLMHIKELGMEVAEMGRFSSDPSASFTQQCPLPEQQPSKLPDAPGRYPLLGPTTRPAKYADSTYTTARNDYPHRAILQRICLLSDEDTQRCYQFPGKGKGVGSSWRRIRFVIPMPSIDSPGDSRRPTSDSDTPFMKLRHFLRIRIVIRAAGFDEDESLLVDIPIRFGSKPETLPSRGSFGPPPYIAVFHENGEPRDCDPLPLYPGAPTGAPFTQDATLPALENTNRMSDIAESSFSVPHTPPQLVLPSLPSLGAFEMEVDTEVSSPTTRASLSPSAPDQPPRSTSALSMTSTSARSSWGPSPASSPEPRTIKLPTIAEQWAAAAAALESE